MARTLDRLRFHIFKWFSPFMVSGYTNPDGRRLKHCRVGNTTTLQRADSLELSDNVFIGHYNFVDATGGIKIAEGCQITNYCSIITHSSHVAIRLYGKHYTAEPDPVAYHKAPVVIGPYTFIGPHTLIMPGTVIGKGCLISAYAQVRGEVPDFAIMAGNPAKQVGDTREKDQVWLDQHPELQRFYDEWTAQ